MRSRRSSRTAAFAFALFSLAAVAQEHPNFAGDWIVTSFVGDNEVRGFTVGTDQKGHTTITQDANTLAVAWVSFSRAHQAVQAVVNLDGSERRYTDRNSVEPQERTTRARWVGARLAITTKWAGWTGPGTPVPTPVETEEILSLESASILKVEITRRVRDQILTGTRTFRRQ